MPPGAQDVRAVLDKEPIHLIYFDPTAHVLDEADTFLRPEAAVGDLELADEMVGEIDEDQIGSPHGGQ